MKTWIAKNGVEHTILHFNNGFVELPVEWIRKAKQELELKVVLGLDEISAVDRLAYIMISETY